MKSPNYPRVQGANVPTHSATASRASVFCSLTYRVRSHNVSNEIDGVWREKKSKDSNVVRNVKWLLTLYEG